MKRTLLIGLLLIPLLLIGVALTLLGTRTGNLWLLDRADPFLPGELTVTDWHGNLLTGVTVEHLGYRQGEASDTLSVELQQFHLELAPLDLLRGWVMVNQLKATHVTLQLPSGKEPPSDDTPFALPDSLAMPLGIRIEALSVDRFTLAGDNPLHVDQINLRELAAWRKLNLPHLALTVADTRLRANLNGQLATPYQLRGELDWQRPGTASSVPQTKGRLTFNGTPQALNLAHVLSAPAALISDGKVGYRDGQVHLDLAHRWPEQPLPVETPVPITLDPGTLTSRGTLDQLHLQTEARVTADQHPVTLTLDANASLEHLILDTLRLDSEGQSLTLNGRLDYQDGLAWDLTAKGRQLNPATLAPKWPGDLDLDAKTRGHWRDDGWIATVDPLSLNGTLHGDPIKLDASAQQKSETSDLSLALKGHWGSDRLSAQGQIGEHFNLDGTLNIQRLARWHAPAQGQLQASWRLRGPLQAATLSGQAQGRALGLQNWRLETLKARFQDLNLEQQPMSLTVEGDQLSDNGDSRLEKLTLALQGRRQDHHLDITLKAKDATTKLFADASLDDNQVWSGRLLEWQLQEQRLGTWKLAESAAFELGTDRQSMDGLCLESAADPGRLCITGEHTADQRISANVEIRQLPLALAEPWLNGEIALDGRLNAEARIGGNLEQPSGEWSLVLEDATTRLLGTETPVTLAFEQAALSGRLEDGQLKQELDLAITDLGQLHLRARSGLTQDAPMQGNLQISIPELDVLAPVLLRVGELEGRMQGDIDFKGTPADPHIRGQLALTDGRATVPELGISAESVDLAITGDASDTLHLDGQAQLGEGTLKLGGTWQPSQSPLALDLWARGEQLRVADRADAQVLISPDLKLQGDDEGLNLTGNLTVPEADLNPHELPESAVTVSEDQILVDAQAEETTPLPFAMGINVALGDRVHFQGFGLRATLTGELRVSQRPGKPAQLNGELIITEGRYQAYGQNLLIENGRLLFQGQPDNPGLDIRAVRKIPSENLVVGVQLSGTLQEPDARIFSDPSLEESEAMSYLITGRSLNRGSQSDSAQVAQALALYSLQKGSGVTDKIGDSLGFDEVSIGSDWETADAALMLGKQLSDRLYLTYAVGLFDAISTVMLRYTLTRQLHLEAQSSSKSQALDLIWEKELK